MDFLDKVIFAGIVVPAAALALLGGLWAAGYVLLNIAERFIRDDDENRTTAARREMEGGRLPQMR